MVEYPSWLYYPSYAEPPSWVAEVVDVFRKAQGRIDSSIQGKRSDEVLAELAEGLRSLGFDVEAKGRAGKIRRAVLFGEQGEARVSYEVDAVHDSLGIVAEVEAGRGWQGNAFYRDIVRTSLDRQRALSRDRDGQGVPIPQWGQEHGQRELRPRTGST